MDRNIGRRRQDILCFFQSIPIFFRRNVDAVDKLINVQNFASFNFNTNGNILSNLTDENDIEKLVDISDIKSILDYPGPHNTNLLYQIFVVRLLHNQGQYQQTKCCLEY